MTSHPLTSVVIVTHRRPGGLKELLESLTVARMPAGLGEILVIENGDPASGSREIAAAARLAVPVHWHFLADRRLAVTRNFGIRAATGDFVIIYDDDIHIGVDALAGYVDAARDYGPGHFFGGPLEPRQDVAPPEWLNAYLPSSARGWTLGAARQFITAPAFLGSNFAAYKADVLAVGGYPEYLGPGQTYRIVGGEETLLQQRMLDKGLKGVFVPEAVVRHYVPVERCSPAFAIERHYQYSLVCVIAEHIEKGLPPSRLPPGWVWRGYLSAYAALAWQRLCRADARSQLEAGLVLNDYRAQFVARAIMARHQLPARYPKAVGYRDILPV